MRPTRHLFLFFFLLAASQTATATCVFFSDHKPYDLNYTLPKDISIPRDTPNGTIIYHDEITLSSPPNSYKCDKPFSIGSSNVRGGSDINGAHPIGNTNFAWILIENSTKLNGYPFQYLVAGEYGFGGRTYGIEIIKNGDSTGSTIPGGTLGYYLVDNTLQPLRISITSTKIITQTCQTPENIFVDLGKPGLSSFLDYTTATLFVFSVQLSNCPKGINQIRHRLIPTASSPALYPSNGIISLNSKSTAKGIGIQLRHSFAGIYDLNQTLIASEFKPGASNYNIHMYAQYVRLPGVSHEDVKPGTANAEIMFAIEYL